MNLDDLIDCPVSVLIEYFDTDRSTLMHAKSVEGVVQQVHADIGVAIKVHRSDETTSAHEIFKVPPLLDAWQLQIDGSFNVHWQVFRTQQERQDGVHEWWDWQPVIKPN